MWGKGLLLAAVVAGLTAAGCGESRSTAAVPQSRPPMPVQVEIASLKSHTRSVVVPGIVEARASISLGFRVDGFVERFLVDEGDRVEKGATIAALDATDLEREVSIARASLDRAEVRAKETTRIFERQKQLLATKSISRETFDAAEAESQMTRAALREARLQLDIAQDRRQKATLTAPVTGYIEKRLLEEHEPARAGAPAVILAEIDTVKVRGAVADSMMRLLRVGNPVAIQSPAWPDRTFGGRVHHVAVAADSSSRTVPFEVTLDNGDLALRPEMVVEIEIPTGENETAIDVPLSAVLRGADLEPFCFVVVDGADGPIAQRRLVRFGNVYEDRVAVTGGLKAGDRVVVRGQHFLATGERVAVVSG